MAQWKQFEAFYHVVRHHGIPEAARALGVDRSTLSGHLNALEKHLGVTLCARRPFKLTPPGARLFAAPERAHDLLAEGLR